MHTVASYPRSRGPCVCRAWAFPREQLIFNTGFHLRVTSKRPSLTSLRCLPPTRLPDPRGSCLRSAYF